MNLSLTKKYFGIAVILSLVICITIHFPLILGVIFEDEGGRGAYGSHRKFAFDAGLAMLDFFNTFFVSFLIFTLNFYLLKPFLPPYLNLAGKVIIIKKAGGYCNKERPRNR